VRFLLFLATLAGSVAAMAAAPRPELPSWFPPPAGQYEPLHFKHFDFTRSPALYLWDDHRRQREVQVDGAYWEFDMGLPGSKTAALKTPEAVKAWSDIRTALERQGYTMAFDAGKVPPGSMVLRKEEGGRTRYVQYHGANEIRIVETGANPFQVKLIPPAEKLERLTTGEDIPYAAPIPGSKLLHGRDYEQGESLEYPCRAKGEIRGTRRTEREYEAPPGLSAFAAKEAYDKAFHEAGWDYTCVQSGLVARYTRNGRDVWVHVTFGLDGAPARYTIAASDTGAGLRADLRKGCTAALYGVNFDFDKATLRPDSEPALNQVLALMKDDPKLAVEIGGHTDNAGKPDYNMKLSDDRAAAVVRWLVARGIAAPRLTSHGYGDSQPLVKNSSEENRARNRRVELKRKDCR